MSAQQIPSPEPLEDWTRIADLEDQIKARPGRTDGKVMSPAELIQARDTLDRQGAWHRRLGQEGPAWECGRVADHITECLEMVAAAQRAAGIQG